MSLPTDYQTYIHASRYARWRDDLGRRETWEETVERLLQFWRNKFPEFLDRPGKEFGYTYPDSNNNNTIGDIIKSHIQHLYVMPSMRTLMTAGEALERDNVAGYNCAYTTASRLHAFDEIMYTLMCGTGVGFSVERQYINLLPKVAEEFHESSTTIHVPDSKIGWATSFRELLSLLYSGKVPKWDLSKVRPAGERLKVFGGRSSGPEPLNDLFKFAVNLFTNTKGRKLNSIECHDLICKIADIVVVGGVRRSALISLSNLTDERMRYAKSGEWYYANAQRALANNSVCYTEKPDIGIFMREWNSLYESKSGERGIFNREASKKLAEKTGRRDSNYDFGTNPCSEIILRDRQFCNLSEIVIRPNDSPQELINKAKTATILGTLQATLTNFRYLSHKWKENTEEERLLGVSLTGIMDHPILSNISEVSKDILTKLKQQCIDTNEHTARLLNINPSASITCVKPSGTVSQLVNSSSGIHPRYSKYYTRRVLGDKKDPLISFLNDAGVPNEPSIYYPGQVAFSFPIKTEGNPVCRNDRNAIEQLEIWKFYAENWCEHKPSVTIYVKEHEWMEVGAWVYKNFDILSGVSFLPFDAGSYKQTPYEELSEESYNKQVALFPTKITWENLVLYETVDNTTIQPELSCSAGACEV